MSSQSPIQIVMDAFNEFKAANTARLDDLEKKINRSAIFGVGMGGCDLGARDLATARNALAAFAKTGVIDARASMNTVIDPDGGYIVAPELDTRIQQLQRNLSPMRRIARIVQTKASTYKLPVNVGGTASGWVGETAPRPETSSPDLALLDFPAGEIYAMPAVTQRLLDDSPVNIVQFLEGEIEGVWREGGDGLSHRGRHQQALGSPGSTHRNNGRRHPPLWHLPAHFQRQRLDHPGRWSDQLRLPAQGGLPHEWEVADELAHALGHPSAQG